MSEMATSKHAIILRGPPAIGKSSVTKLLKSRLPNGSVKDIDLDQGWGVQQNLRYPTGERRYADLKSPEDVLIIELGCGEPPDWSFAGATTNPREWVQVLESEGREIHAFLLLTDHATWRQRMLKKVEGNERDEEQFYQLFERQEWKQFPQKACVQEECIDTTTVNQQQVADRIWKRVQGAAAAPAN